MDNSIPFYLDRLNLKKAAVSRIEHGDAIVAIVYRITTPSGIPLILKIHERPNDYLREVYFLKYFAGKLPVPKIVQVVEPEKNTHGAILMEYLSGALLKIAEFTDELAFEIGSKLAQIHLNRTKGYGDLLDPKKLSPDPSVPFRSKFEEGLAECENHLPEPLIEQCRTFFNDHVHLVAKADGPCIVHRDFRPGNLIVHEGKLQGIIDWASARASFAEEDFCPMEHGEWSNSSNRQPFLEGYASIRPVPNYMAMMPLLRLSKAIATIGFTVKRGTWESSAARLYQVNRRFLETFF